MDEMVMEKCLSNCAFGNCLYYETLTGRAGLGILRRL